MRKLVKVLGPLRLLLLTLVAVSAVSAGFAGGEVSYEFPAVIPTLVAPPFAVMLTFIVALDMLMTALFLSDRTGAERARYRVVLLTELGAVAILVAVWIPFFRAVLSR